MIPTKEMLVWLKSQRVKVQGRLLGADCVTDRIAPTEELKIIDDFLSLISRADDVDRLVEAAKEVTTIIHAKTADDQTEYKIAGAEIKLRAALVPFKEKP